MGSSQRRADVVLINSEGTLTAIAECKGIGYDGNDGIEQLESYLNASGTLLGLFADDTDPYEWVFLKKIMIGTNMIRSIVPNLREKLEGWKKIAENTIYAGHRLSVLGNILLVF